MSFKYFPATITPDGQKVPLLKGWKEIATDDVNIIESWRQQYRERLTHFGIVCGEQHDLFVLDVDVKGNGFESLREKGLVVPPTVYQYTLNGGCHYFFRYPKDGKKYSNKVGILNGVDVRSTGGYVLCYQPDFKYPIVEAPTWLLDLYNKTSDGPIEGASTNVRLSPEIARDKFNTACEAIRHAPAGESNNTLNVQSYLVGQLVASQAITYEFAYAELYKVGIERKGEQRAYEVQETIKSGLNGGMQNPMVVRLPDTPPPLAFEIPQAEVKERWTPRYFTLGDLRDRSKLRQPQLFEHWSTQDILLTTADGGTGKTTLKLFEAVMGVLGERFLGFECKKPGFKTLFITGEDTAEKLGAMLGVMLEQLGLFEPLPGNAEKVDRILKSVIVKKEEDMCLLEKLPGGFLVPSVNAYNKVMEAVQDFKPDLIVFDPIASFWGSESALNDMSRAVTKFMSKLKAQGLAVEMINHMGKSSSQTKDETQFAGRGGTGLPSHSRVSRVFHTITSEEYRELTGKDLEDGVTVIRCNVNKFTDGSPLFNKPFLIIRKGYIFTREDLSAQKQVEELTRKTDAERVFTFVKKVRDEGKFPTVKYVIACMKADQNKLSEARVKEALQVLAIDGHLGERVVQTPHPDAMITEKVLVIKDSNEKEVS